MFYPSVQTGHMQNDHGEMQTGSPLWGDKYRWGGLKFTTFDEKRAITRKQ